MRNIIVLTLLTFPLSVAAAEEWDVLFDGSSLDRWEYADGGWVVEDDGSMSCRMETVVDKKGNKRTRGKGYVWTKESYGDFQLTLSYKLSETANSGVFFRTDKDNPVQGGFEIQLLDNAGFQKVKGKKDAKNLNGAFYDCKPAEVDPAHPVGQWNRLTLECVGPNIRFSINGVPVNSVNIDKWDTPNQNPDGTKNKFKTALKELPRIGRIGFQNHGQQVWFKDVKIRSLD